MIRKRRWLAKRRICGGRHGRDRDSIETEEVEAEWRIRIRGSGFATPILADWGPSAVSAAIFTSPEYARRNVGRIPLRVRSVPIAGGKSSPGKGNLGA